MGAVCLPKYLSPHQSPCLCCLFVLSFSKNTCTFAHSLTCGHLQVVCSQSGTPRNVQPPRSLIHKCNPMLACTVQAHKHCYTLGCAHTYIDVRIPCAHMPKKYKYTEHVYSWETHRHKLASISLPKHTQVHTHGTICTHVHSGTHIHAGKGQGFRW